MATNTKNLIVNPDPVSVVGQPAGVTVIPDSTPLTRLNYFDGKFLRADDLRAEQLYQRRLVRLSNQAGPVSIAYGYDVSLGGSGDTLQVSAGLAIAPDGSVLYLPAPASAGVQELIDKSAAALRQTAAGQTGPGTFQDCVAATANPPGTVASGGALYLITISSAEAYCGAEDVFGTLCAEACVTSTDRPYIVEGIVLRAVPLVLHTPLPASKSVPLTIQHLRSRVASAYFADERLAVASLISGAGLHSGTWCFGADGPSGREVPLGVIARSGGKSVFLDAWIARREAIETTARRYWAWRMAMRPWDVFLAQILQFQCQLRDAFVAGPVSGGGDPCAGQKQAIQQASDTFGQLKEFYEAVTTRFTVQPLLSAGTASDAQPPAIAGGLAAISGLLQKLAAARDTSLAQSSQALVDFGFVSLPPAGYLPVAPGSAVTVNQQIAHMMGKGMDLRFCVVRPDYVPHAVEETQHMDRISLVQGLDDPARLERVDILVPDGEIVAEAQAAGTAFQANLQFRPGLGAPRLEGTTAPAPAFSGAARIAISDSDGVQLFLSADTENPASTLLGFVNAARLAGSLRAAFIDRLNAGAAAASAPLDACWFAVTCSQNPFSPNATGQANVEIRVITGDTAAPGTFNTFRINGVYRFGRAISTSLGTRVTGTLTGAFSSASSGGQPGGGELPPVEISLLLTPAAQNQPATLQVTATANETSYIFAFRWAGTPLAVTASLTIQFAERTQEVLTALLQTNPDVLTPANTFHGIALRALKILGGDIADTTFASIAGGQLFPPPPAATAALIVNATLDWVAFTRRREKQCGAVQAAPPPPLPRQYRVYHHEILSHAKADTLAAIRSALLSGNSSFLQQNNIGFTAVDVVEFGAGIATLDTAPAAVGGDWQKIKPAKQIVYGAIGSQGAAVNDGDALALDRLDSLEQALVSAGGAALAITLGPDVLKQIVSPPLDATNVDGVIVLLTQAQAVAPPFTLTAGATPINVQPSPSVAVADVILTGTGGAAGQNTAIDFTFTVNTGVTNPTSSPPTLTVDNNAPLNGTVSQGNQIVFAGVPIVFPAAGAHTTLRLGNVLVNSAALSSGAAPASVNILVAANPAQSISNPTVLVANVTATQKTAKLFIWRGGPAGDRSLVQTNPAVLVVTFVNDVLTGSLPNQVFQFPIQGIDYEAGGAPPDAGVAKRVASVVQALKTANPTAPTPTTRTGSVVGNERHFLTDSGVTTDDLIFLAINPGLVP